MDMKYNLEKLFFLVDDNNPFSNLLKFARLLTLTTSVKTERGVKHDSFSCLRTKGDDVYTANISTAPLLQNTFSLCPKSKCSGSTVHSGFIVICLSISCMRNFFNWYSGFNIKVFDMMALLSL